MPVSEFIGSSLNTLTRLVAVLISRVEASAWQDADEVVKQNGSCLSTGCRKARLTHEPKFLDKLEGVKARMAEADFPQMELAPFIHDRHAPRVWRGREE